MVNSITARSILPTLPPELLGRVFEFVDNGDLINLRLVCKVICAAANRPFAIRHFGHSHHVVTEHSIEVLLKVSDHPVFGPFIRRVMVSSARKSLKVVRYVFDEDPDGDTDEDLDEDLDEDTEDDDVAENSFVESGQFSDLMQRAFANLKRNPHPITIAVHEDRYIPRVDEYSTTNSRKWCCGARAFVADSGGKFVFRTAETVRLVSKAADAAGLRISTLEIELMSVPTDSTMLRTQKAIRNFLQARTMPLNIHLGWDDCSTLEYEHREGRLSFSGSSLLIDYPEYKYNLQTLNEVVQWVGKHPVLELQLIDLEIKRLSFLDGYFLRSLQSIRIEETSIGSALFNEGLYSSLFERLSGLPNLNYCRLSRLHYRLPEERNIASMHLLSGLYPTRWASLLLIFPNGETDFEIKGNKISRQLEDLAAYTAAAERRKVLAIEAAQEVTDYRVVGVDTPINYDKEDFEYRLK